MHTEFGILAWNQPGFFLPLRNSLTCRLQNLVILGIICIRVQVGSGQLHPPFLHQNKELHFEPLAGSPLLVLSIQYSPDYSLERARLGLLVLSIGWMLTPIATYKSPASKIREFRYSLC